MIFTLNAAHGATSAKEKVVKDYWKETTPLSFNLLQAFLEGEECLSDIDTFQGCTAAVNTLAAYTRGNATLTTHRMVTDHRKDYGKILMTSGLLVVAEKRANTNPSRLSLSELQRLESTKDQARKASLAEAFAAVPAPFDLGAIFKFLVPRVLSVEQEAAIAATCINAYFSTAVDPHTYITPAAEIAKKREGKGESLFGIGANLGTVNGKVIVISPMENSPALKAGLKANDIITAVDEKAIEGLDLSDVVGRIRGEAGTLVRLQIARKNQTLSITITRDQVKIENVQSRLLQDRGTKIAYIRLGSFSAENGCSEMKRQLIELQSAGASGLILDLRGNGGGLLDQAQCISGLFLGPNQVVTQSKNLMNNEVTEYRSPPDEFQSRLPMITLIDGGSASASEIVAGALQDHGRSWIAGSRSYGKATVQKPFSWKIGGVRILNVTLYATTARFYQPSGRTNQVVGIIPDFLLDPKPYATEDDRFAQRESDLFKNALPPIGPVWHQDRQAAANDVQRCLLTTSQATELFQARQDDAIPPDYALLEAQDLMVCAQP